jgi:uncharacterized OB-fold protein
MTDSAPTSVSALDSASVASSAFAPPVSPSPDAAPFWQAANRGELELPFCLACQEFFFYPRTLCPRCGSRAIEWRACSGQGSVYTFCIQHQTTVPGAQAAVPFVTAIVELEEGPRLMSLLVDVPAAPESVRCGMRVEVGFLALSDGQNLPVFRPASPET